MTHKKVYDYYVSYFPQYAKHTVEWFPNGKNSVRVRQTDGQDYVFTYQGKRNWRFETVDSFIKHLKGERKMEC